MSEGVDPTVVAAFMARVETRRAIHAHVAACVAHVDVDDLVQTAWVEAAGAAERSPPADENAVPAWLKTIAERVVADHLAQRARRARYEGPMPDADVDDVRAKVAELAAPRELSVRVRGASYRVVLTPDLEAGGFSVEVPDLPGVITEADSIGEARTMASDAVRLWLDAKQSASPSRTAK